MTSAGTFTTLTPVTVRPGRRCWGRCASALTGWLHGYCLRATLYHLLAHTPEGCCAPSNPGGLLFSKGSGDGNFGAITTAANLSFSPNLVVRDNFNDHGKTDLVVAGSRLVVLLGQGNSSFGAELAAALPAGVSTVMNLAVGDVNGDGRDDVVVATAAGVFVYYAQAGGSLQAAVLVDASTGVGPLKFT